MTMPRGSDSKQLMNSIEAGWRSAPGRNGVGYDPMGAVMGFMGVPNLAGGAFRNGQYGGTQGILQRFYGPGGPGHRPKPDKPGTGGNDPGTGGDGTGTGNQDDQNMIKAGLPPWWVDWLHTNGEHGGWMQPPGLLG